jgi:hydroxypyruvate isomerase
MAIEEGLTVASHGGHQSISSGLNDLSQHDRIVSEISYALELTAQYRIENLIVFSGERYPGLTEEQGIENTALGLSKVAKVAEDAGVNLAMELLNSKVNHPAYQCDKTAWGVAVCERVGSPRVRLLYDIYHMQIMEGDIIRTIRDSSPWFCHYHTAGNPGRQDMDETQELNYPPIYRAIAGTGYEGFVGHEFVPKGEPITALQAAFDQCHGSM